MPNIKWSTLIADDSGVIDYARLKSFTAIVLGLLGAAVVLGAAVLELGLRETLPDSAVSTAVYALVVPLTGGVLMTGWNKGKLQLEERKRLSQAQPAVVEPDVPPPPERDAVPPLA
jgi:hypothetical protein